MSESFLINAPFEFLISHYIFCRTIFCSHILTTFIHHTKHILKVDERMIYVMIASETDIRYDMKTRGTTST